jgi:hypothetical protein
MMHDFVGNPVALVKEDRAGPEIRVPLKKAAHPEQFLLLFNAVVSGPVHVSGSLSLVPLQLGLCR